MNVGFLLSHNDDDASDARVYNGFHIDLDEEFREEVERSPEECLCIAVISRAVEDFLSMPQGMSWQEYDRHYRDAVEFLTCEERVGCWCAPLGLDPEAVCDRFKAMLKDPTKARQARHVMLLERFASRIDAEEDFCLAS